MRPLPASVASRLAAVLADPVGVPLPVFNSLLSALAASVDPSHGHLPLYLFRRRLLPFRRPDAFTLSVLTSALPSAAVTLHALALRLGLLHADPVLANSLLRLYICPPVPCQGLARRLFEEMPARTASSYNTLISHSHDDVWGLVRRMVADGCAPDRFTMSAVLPVCTSARWGRELHCYAVRDWMCGDDDFHVSSGLVSMYCRVGHPDSARTVFNRMARRNVVCWTAMVGGYIENGMFDDAVDCFRAMWLIDAIPPNRITLITVLSAIEALSSLAEGKQVHGFAVRMMMHAEMSLNNALIDTYAKCGALHYARRIFDDTSWCKDVISWGAMILGYGIHACCHAGLVLKGLNTYSSMVNDHGVHPTEEMCACMVDLLGRSGNVYHALDFVKSMSVEPGSSVWGALLDASVKYDNKEIQDLASRSLLRLEQGKPSNLVAVSNLNASSERWNIVKQVRDTINQGSLKKKTGCSWVNPI
ncbi:pentatricopeptide repeat-containing protein At3g46790, chloroplastic isoform X2 [Zea mays]|uniref:pentatricopeptide repeat-containing protein At3g46790, chloroplastic isoform X2 n=1 Tax=Zea mays TaxID=4577 RepID=UPI0009A9A412|nr:pentatricopeptide repeat-containing protein At3g46790, chloroplastic isoform X2 [Zea mays]XP_035816770.1 pentatricopeptide repeat-containing protein At3g46790, chloroplastic isoform X2 [Zea mays]XP_035816771.1 pentatricopeptide repeat-containing protein At3g46790, chloroplastic isoform X2 [Zea mays]|eukprot:XP_020396691.1 pentatricopeptide repeat-containing protein At3g46790, chloroplastic isoform X2 [Zea mays]